MKAKDLLKKAILEYHWAVRHSVYFQQLIDDCYEELFKEGKLHQYSDGTIETKKLKE